MGAGLRAQALPFQTRGLKLHAKRLEDFGVQICFASIFVSRE